MKWERCDVFSRQTIIQKCRCLYPQGWAATFKFECAWVDKSEEMPMVANLFGRKAGFVWMVKHTVVKACTRLYQSLWGKIVWHVTCGGTWLIRWCLWRVSTGMWRRCYSLGWMWSALRQWCWCRRHCCRLNTPPPLLCCRWKVQP